MAYLPKEKLNIGESPDQSEAEKRGPVFTSYELEPRHSGGLRLHRPEGTEFFVTVDLHLDPGVKKVKIETTFEGLNPSENRIVEASLKAADCYLSDWHLEDLRTYYRSWREIKAPDQVTKQRAYYDPTPLESDGEVGLTVEPELKEYLVFQEDGSLDEIKRELLEESLKTWIAAFRERFEGDTPSSFYYLAFTSFGGYKYKKGPDGELRKTRKECVKKGGPPVEVENEPITWETFEKDARDFVFADLAQEEN